jgi:hypothetical protein
MRLVGYADSIPVIDRCKRMSRHSANSMRIGAFKIIGR